MFYTFKCAYGGFMHNWSSSPLHLYLDYLYVTVYIETLICDWLIEYLHYVRAVTAGNSDLPAFHIWIVLLRNSEFLSRSLKKKKKRRAFQMHRSETSRFPLGPERSIIKWVAERTLQHNVVSVLLVVFRPDLQWRDFGSSMYIKGQTGY